MMPPDYGSRRAPDERHLVADVRETNDCHRLAAVAAALAVTWYAVSFAVVM